MGPGDGDWFLDRSQGQLSSPSSCQPLHMFQILCIDEATASVDQKTDQLLQQTICKRFANKTVLTIAHRYASVQHEILMRGYGVRAPRVRALEIPTPQEPPLLILGAHPLRILQPPSHSTDQGSSL